MECRLAGETEVLGEKPAPAPLLSNTKSHMSRPGFEPGPPLWEADITYHTEIRILKLPLKVLFRVPHCTILCFDGCYC
jgi:hypothetical protein